nr:nicotinate-nucleotide--dimethylbenzimidazole phosphoribosyltransferase [Granulosicoccus sp.]
MSKTNDQPAGWPQLEQWFPSVNSSERSLTVSEVREAIDQKTKPPGSLGQLEYVAAQLA